MSLSSGRQKTTSKSTIPDHVIVSPGNAFSEAGGVQLQGNRLTEADTSAAVASKRRRRPKKINNANQDSSLMQKTAFQASAADVTIEMKALKSKVMEIEAQVQEILLRPASQGPTKSARRRSRRQKSSSAENQSGAAQDEKEDERALAADSGTANELQDLQGQLQDAHEELLVLKERDKKRGTTSAAPASLSDESEDEVEDIPRSHDPALAQQHRPRPLGRAVTLSGSYRIPIPVNVSDADFDAISRGIKSAQSIARSFIDASAERDHSASRSAQTTSTDSGPSGSWSEWFGGYSMSIAKAVDKVQITSNLETVPQRPQVLARSETAPPVRRKPQKLEMRSKKRSDMPGVSRKLSDTQVAGLLA